MRKRKKTVVSSNRGARIAKKSGKQQLEWLLTKTMGACQVLLHAERIYSLWERIKPLIEQIPLLN